MIMRQGTNGSRADFRGAANLSAAEAAPTPPTHCLLAALGLLGDLQCETCPAEQCPRVAQVETDAVKVLPAASPIVATPPRPPDKVDPAKERSGDAAWLEHSEVKPAPTEQSPPGRLLEAVLAQRVRSHTPEVLAANQKLQEVLRAALQSMQDVFGDKRPPAASGAEPVVETQPESAGTPAVDLRSRHPGATHLDGLAP